MKVLIPIEFVERDLLPSAYLAEMIVSQLGLECIIGPQTLLQRVAQDLKNSFLYFDKSLAGSKLQFVNRLRANCIYVSSDAEYTGIVNGEYYIQTRFHKQLVDRAQAIFPATNEERLLLTQRCTETTLNIVFPYRQLSHLRYSQFHSEEVIEIQKKLGDFSLIVSSFGGHHRPGGITDLYNWSEKHFDNEENKRSFRKKTLMREKLRIDFVGYITELAKATPNENFVLRPHPRESVESWKFYNLPDNIYVTDEASITTMLMCSKKLIHAGCTTAVEAWHLKKPIIFFKSCNTEDGVKKFYSNYASTIYDSENNRCVEKSEAPVKPFDQQIMHDHIMSLSKFLQISNKEKYKENILLKLVMYSKIRPLYKNNNGKFNKKMFSYYATKLAQMHTDMDIRVLRGANCLIIK